MTAWSFLLRLPGLSRQLPEDARVIHDNLDWTWATPSQQKLNRSHCYFGWGGPVCFANMGSHHLVSARFGHTIQLLGQTHGRKMLQGLQTMLSKDDRRATTLAPSAHNKNIATFCSTALLLHELCFVPVLRQL